jgi:sarcosine oxidase
VGGTPSVPTELRWPTFVHHTGPDDGWPGGVYGVGVPCAGVKVGFGGAGPRWDPDGTDPAPEQAQLSRLQDYVGEFLPGLDAGAPTRFRCAFVSTPDAEFLLERTGPLVVAAGFSGHGFKFATALGRMVSDLVGDPDPESRRAPASSR